MITDTNRQWEFFVYSSPLPSPLNFGLHTRVVTVQPNGQTHRYEIHVRKNKKHPDRGYFYKDWIPAFVGLKQYFWSKTRNNGKILYHIQGGEGTLAHTIVTFVDAHSREYPYTHQYRHIPGPNCNTFTQRIINHFPEISLTLPRNAFGKGYMSE